MLTPEQKENFTYVLNAGVVLAEHTIQQCEQVLPVLASRVIPASKSGELSLVASMITEVATILQIANNVLTHIETYYKVTDLDEAIVGLQGAMAQVAGLSKSVSEFETSMQLLMVVSVFDLPVNKTVSD